MNRFLAILITLLVTPCCAQDYSITDSLTQTINAETIMHLVIECHCKDGVDIEEVDAEIITIDVIGIEGSVGYHGIQEEPEEINQERLSFKTEVDNDTLRLVSRERAFMHHFYLIEELSIHIPKGLSYEVVKISGGELEEREVK